MNTSKLGAICMSALLAMAVLVPTSALAEPNLTAAEYGDGEGSGNTTALMLVAQNPDENLASNGGTDWVKQNAKVQVPVAINFVAKGDGTILGPSSGVYITNFSAFNVNVSRIKTVDSNGATLVPEASCDAADEIYLSFKPGTDGTPIDLSAYKGQNGVATRSGEWDIAASAGDSGTSLELTGFTGKIGGFNGIDPTSKTTVGEIEWTIKAGSGRAVSLANTSVSTLQADSVAIRGGNSAVAAVYEPSVGQTLNVKLGNGSDAQVMLVDVSSDKGLVFMFTEPIVGYQICGWDSGKGWPGSVLRKRLNSSFSDNGNGVTGISVYTSYLQGMTIGGTTVVPAKVTNTSASNSDGTYEGSGDNRHSVYRQCEVTTDENNNGPADDGDMYWFASVVEIYGSFPSGSSYSGDEGCSQFAYFRNLGITASDYSALAGKIGSTWWLRTANPGDTSCTQFYAVNGTSGQLVSSIVSSANGVVPCFAL